LSDDQLVSGVRSQLTDWFGPAVADWRYLRSYWILHALPLQTPPLSDPMAPVRPVRPGLYTCGEYCNPASLQLAMVSGRRTGETVLEALK
jgi:hypothetical protein